jgi:diacylglycerol kinase (ATP)
MHLLPHRTPAEAHGGQPRTALVVANPIAGRGRGRRAAEELAAGLRRAGLETELFLTSGRGQASAQAAGARDRVDVIVSVGGDGTQNEVLSGARGGRAAIAQLPLGTANVLAHELRLPRRVADAVEVIRRGRTCLLDTAMVNGRLSFLCVGVGIDGYAVREVERLRRGAITKLLYVAAMARVLPRYRAPRLELEIDGRAVEGRFGFVLISNVRGYGGVFQLSKQCRHADAQVEVYALRSGSTLDLLRMALAGILHRLPSGPVQFWQGRHVRVLGSDTVPFQVDGDFGGEGPVDYRVSDYRPRIVLP